MRRVIVDDEGGWPTVRRFARTISEAFPDERAQAIEVGHRSLLWRARRLLSNWIHKKGTR